MGGKIPVTVVSGFLGSGKTTLLNRMLNGGRGDSADPGPGTVVLINELGDVALDHERFMQLDSRVVVLESGCVCCTVRGDLVNALRQLFLDALHRKIPPLSDVVIETTGIADPATLMYTLTYERFLADRYAYAGCITVVDTVHGAQHLLEQTEAVQQATLADTFVISKIDLADLDALVALRRQLDALNPGAPQYSMQALPQAGELFRTTADRRRAVPGKPPGRLWSPTDASASAPLAHAGTGTLAMAWHRPLSRADVIRGLSDLLAEEGVLRLKGKVFFQGEPGASLVHAVHQRLYPIEPLDQKVSASFGTPAADRPQDNARSVLVFIFRHRDGNGLLRRANALLPAGAEILSPDGNFIQ